LNFQLPSDFNSGPTKYFTVAYVGNNGSISINIKDQPFDKNNISDIYGPITSPNEISIGGRAGVYYQIGDAGCGTLVALAKYSDIQTLEVNFSSCEGSYVSKPLYDDTELATKILSTFKFNIN